MNSATASNMGPGQGKFPVTVKKRRKYEGKSWQFRLTEDKGQFALADSNGKLESEKTFLMEFVYWQIKDL
ncbi:hypothetical protein N7530_008979 [Penicillium desertorum]|uniref:Uncharacterized protein n=1 Tax=Penicillium desertorum TaxID=1303715 RepID=A0A9X0BLT6_9EURO|nr:hypothetical protein N7530_008979 [Penicillium desertorum]